MGVKEDLQALLTETQNKLNILNSISDDVYNIGTIVRFSAASNTQQWHIKKVSEGSWKNLSSAATKQLAEWILHFNETNIGYFEAYVMNPEATPFYASA